MKKNSHDDLFDEISVLIRAGQSAKAASLYKAIKVSKLLSANERVLYSSLSRRLNLPQFGLKLLHPRVRPGRSKINLASESEKIEYAALLVRIGATEESLGILTSISKESKNPLVDLFQGFAHIGQWEYETANKFLLKFINAKNVSHYDSMVATANLCEGLVYQMHESAHSVILKALEEAKQHKYTIIYGHLQMTLANFAIQKEVWKEAEEALREAAICFSNSETLEDLFIRKWKAVLHFYKDKGRNKKELHSLRAEAETKWKHWETMRDCDYVEAIVTKNESLYQRLYFGTPYASFRRKLKAKWGEAKALPANYAWEITAKAKDTVVIEFFSGSGKERKKLLKARKQVGEMLSVLSQDFYRPIRLVSIHTKLFPNDYFNPLSSISRVRTAILITRGWLKQERCGLVIHGENGMYRLVATKPVALLIPNVETRNMKDATFQKIDLLKSLLTNKSDFTVEDTENALKMSRRSANRLLENALKNNLVIRNGKGVHTCYQLVSEESH